MGKLKTVKNLHNFKFKKINFHSEKWKDKDTFDRQIMYDGPVYPTTFFILDRSSLELFIYFDAFGTKEDPRIIKVGDMPEDYRDATSYIAAMELKIIYIISSTPWEEMKEIQSLDEYLEKSGKIEHKTTDELIEMIVKTIGCALPLYLHGIHKKYLATSLVNGSSEDSVKEIMEDSMFDSFREACIAIIKWAVGEGRSKVK